MSAIFELPIESETLTTDEIIQITGCQRRRKYFRQKHRGVPNRATLTH
jgi:hypothetical protein